MRLLALQIDDMAIGWACWGPGDEKLAFGTWQLGSKWMKHGKLFVRLHQFLWDLNAISPFDAIVYQDIADDAGRLEVGIVSHIMSFAEAFAIRDYRAASPAGWMSYFLRGMPPAKRGAELPGMVMRRAKELGQRPQNSLQASAIGLLDYALDTQGHVPFWRQKAAA